MWQVKLLITLAIVIAYILVIKRIKADFRALKEANSEVVLAEDSDGINEDFEDVQGEYSEEKSTKEATPYDVYPGMVRLFKSSYDTKPLPVFSTNGNYLKEMSPSTLKTTKPNKLKMQFESMPDIDLSAKNSKQDEIKEPKSPLKLPRMRKQQAQQLETVKADAEVTPVPLNVEEVVAETLIALDQSNEESFEVESNIVYQTPSVDNSLSPELQEMLLLAACEEEECFA